MRPQRICLLTLDFVGPIRNGGMGTAFLAAAEVFAAAGHHVTVLYPSGYTENEPVTRWREHYAARGIDFVSLFLEGTQKALGFGAYQWLKAREFDAIHFHEMGGIGYWLTVAKRCGLAFAETTLVCQVHSPTLWHVAHSAQFLQGHAELEVDWLERRSCEGADVVTAPSRYILDTVAEMGWRLPARNLVLPNLLPASFPIAADAPRAPRPVRELVFFGRLEERKGLSLFCESVGRLLRAGMRPERITFLGKVGHMDRMNALAWLADIAGRWPVPWRVVNDLDPHRAREFLAGPGRLAVIASRMENAPYVVLECLAAGLPFLAPDVGGIGELVDAADHASVLYARTPEALAQAMRRALEQGVTPARAQAAPAKVREAWLEFQDALPPAPAPPARLWRDEPPLVSVCMAAFNRHEPLAHAIAAIERQTYPNLELILVDDASTDETTLAFLEALRPRFAARGWTLLRNERNAWQGMTRRRAVEASRGKYLVFMDDDNAAWPDQVETFVAAAEHSGADVLTCQMQPFLGGGPPPAHRATRPDLWIPIGACPAVGLFWNCFGDANMFMTRAAWDRMGGFTDDRAYFEDWEFLMQATLDGLHLECLPEILFRYRVWEGAQTASHDPEFLYRSYARAARPALAAMPEALRPALRLMIERDHAQAAARREGLFLPHAAPHARPDPRQRPSAQQRGGDARRRRDPAHRRPGRERRAAPRPGAAAGAGPSRRAPSCRFLERDPMTKILIPLREALALALPFWRSEERWKARGLLALVVVLNLSLVAMTVMLSYWNREFFNALEARDSGAFFHLLFTWQPTESGPMPGFVWIAVLYILIAVYALYLRQALQIRWRRWNTEAMLAAWLEKRAYYRIALTERGDAKGGTDNPDQRIAEDAKLFVDNTLVLGLGLMRTVVTLFSFLFVLWTLSGPATILGVEIPGYMVWVALIYAALGTVFAHLVGRPLIRLNVQQQKVEADFRYALVRFRENAEGVALHRGEAEEHASLAGRFHGVTANWWALMVATKRLTFFTAGYAQVASVFPFVVAAPRFFSGAIPLGGLTQTAQAFGEVQGALSWIVDNYSSLTEWRATVARLTGFRDAIDAAHAATARGEGVRAAIGAPGAVRVDDLHLTLPDGRVLLDHGTLELKPGERAVLTGASGSGKSTMFRAIAGIWPFGSGSVSFPPGEAPFFLPQRPYLPLGTLRRALAYPAAADRFPEAEILAVLGDVGLAHLAPRLDTEEAWAQQLSGGEQQRVALARALLHKPKWLFLDEATASLDPVAEQRLYELLKERLPGTALLSIAHRPAVAEHHDRHLVIAERALAETR
ncbi:SbmA/BacA-like family transporter [Roseococcus sp.]|uniref:SbmA/BacA-like family transporter n=1 Tax=Roseococcus sp. TaxID=2109646 RepID=UPI003BA86F76